MSKEKIENNIKSLESEIQKLKKILNSGYFKPEVNERYYTIESDGSVNDFLWYENEECKGNFEAANCFKTEQEAETVSFEEVLFRKLRRFSEANNEKELDWENAEETKYFITYLPSNGNIAVSETNSFKDFGQIYFSSNEIAQRAIEEFKEDLLKYFRGEY